MPGLEVERDEANMTLVDRETVDHAVAVVLVLHGLEHAGDNGLAGSIGYFLATDGHGIRRMGKPLLIFGTGYDDVGTMLSQFYFVGFRNLVTYCVSVVSKFEFLKRNKPAPKMC